MQTGLIVILVLGTAPKTQPKDHKKSRKPLKKINEDLATYKEILYLSQDVIHPLFTVHF